MSGSMRLAARNPSVTAGFRWPEMRMVAVTMMDRINPCAVAASNNGEADFACWAAMIAPLPTNTSAKTPTNSATKCRAASLMGVLQGAWNGRRRYAYPRRAATSIACLVVAPHHDRCVDAPEPERVADDDVEVSGASDARHVIEVARLVRRLEVHRWRNPAVAQRERTDGRFDRSRRAERVSVVALRAAYRHPVRVVPEHAFDCQRLRGIVERRRAAVRVDIRDLARRDCGIRERQCYGSRRLRAVGKRRGHVVRVVGQPVSEHLAIDGRTAGDGARSLFENQYRRPFSHHEAVAVAVEGARRRARIVVARGHRANERK